VAPLGRGGQRGVFPASPTTCRSARRRGLMQGVGGRVLVAGLPPLPNARRSRQGQALTVFRTSGWDPPPPLATTRQSWRRSTYCAEVVLDAADVLGRDGCGDELAQARESI